MKLLNPIKTRSGGSPVVIDGSQGEGGGQILRSALALSAITGQRFELNQIRAGRKRPGLMRQHLTCVKAVAELCGAEISDVEIGSTELRFEPKEIRGGEYRFAIGTAGSTSLLAQAILPVALCAPTSVSLELEGGTHVMASPSADYILDVFLPVLERIGVSVKAAMQSHGFFPAGGGSLSFQVDPWTTRSRLDLHERERAIELTAEARGTTGLPVGVLDRELTAARKKLAGYGLREAGCFQSVVRDSLCPGNVLLIRALSGERAVSLSCGVGRHGKRAERVAQGAALEMQRFLASSAPVDEYLADQLLLPLALAGGGGFTTNSLSEHFTTNAEVIRKFLDLEVRTERVDAAAYRVEVVR